MELPQDYTPSLFQQSTNGLYGNHFRFTIDRLPDLSFFIQSVQLPSVSSGMVLQHNPFSTVHHTGDHLSYGTFEIKYIIDAHFKNYFSLYYWMKGYGFPHSFEEVVQFRAKQETLVGAIRPKAIVLEKTHATMQILTPDTSSIVAEIHYDDVFPFELSAVSFETADNEPPLLTTTCTFACSNFDIRLHTE